MSVLFSALLITIRISAFSQSKDSIDLAAYIKSEKYIKLTDTINLPKSVMTYYKSIVNFLDRQHFYKVNEVYIYTGFRQDNAAEWYIPITDIAGLNYYVDLENHIQTQFHVTQHVRTTALC